MNMTEATIYVTRFTTRKLDRSILHMVGTIHRRRFAGHPAGTVQITDIACDRTDGGWRVTITHRHEARCRDIVGRNIHIDRYRIYGAAPRGWYGRHIAPPLKAWYQRVDGVRA